MIAIPNMSKPKSCKECELFYIEFYMGENKMGSACTLNDDAGSTIEADYNSCPLIEIVECKDCKYWTDDMSGNMWCEHAIGGLTEPTDFCSYGDRIDEYEKEYRELGLYELRELRKGERRADE